MVSQIINFPISSLLFKGPSGLIKTNKGENTHRGPAAKGAGALKVRVALFDIPSVYKFFKNPLRIPFIKFL